MPLGFWSVWTLSGYSWHFHPITWRKGGNLRAPLVLVTCDSYRMKVSMSREEDRCPRGERSHD